MPDVRKQTAKDIPAILRKRDISPAEKKLLKTTMTHLGVKAGKKPVLTLKKGKK